MQFLRTFLTYLWWDSHSYYGYPPSRLQAAGRLTDDVTCATCPPLVGTYLYESKCFLESAVGNLPENLTICWYTNLYPSSVKEIEIPLETPYCAYDVRLFVAPSFVLTIENCPNRAYMDSDTCTLCSFD